MLATEKILKAFQAIIDEVEIIRKTDLPAEVDAGLATIISIAKHQSDIRDAKKGSCSSHSRDSG